MVPDMKANGGMTERTDMAHKPGVMDRSTPGCGATTRGTDKVHIQKRTKKPKENGKMTFSLQACTRTTNMMTAVSTPVPSQTGKRMESVH